MSDIDKPSPEASNHDHPRSPEHGAESSKGEAHTLSPSAPGAPPQAEGDTPHLNGTRDPTIESAPADDPTKDDSEAETVLSSPVKRREALRKANGPKLETSGLSESKAVDEERNSASPMARRKSTSVGEGQKDGNNLKQASSTKSASEVDASFEEDDGADAKSDRSSVQSQVAGDNSRTASGSPEIRRAGSEILSDGRARKNPRKRKHRESPGRRLSNAGSVKRQRRASSAGNKHSDSSDELSPPPRLRRHKRTTSGQTKEESEIGAAQSARSRRAASHLPGREQKVFKNDWDSGSESEVSTKQLPGRSTRNGNRSVSTPGRPVGRDHKRHVNKYGFTRLAEACEAGDLPLVKEWRNKDPEQLEQREFAGNTPLQVASLNGYPDVVKYLLDEGCNPHCANSDKDTPLIDAVENEHPEVVRMLLDAGVDPTRQNMKGQQALDLVADGTETAPEIRTMLRTAIEDWKAKGAQRQEQEEEQRVRPGPRQALHFMARTPDNLMKLVLNNDREGVTEFLDARVPVDNIIIEAAAKTGDMYLTNMLLAEMSPRKAKIKAERPMLGVIGSSHIEMVKMLTELDQFNPTFRRKKDGKTWYEIAESKEGPHMDKERELFYRLYTEAQAKSRLSSSPVTKRGENGTARRPKSSDLSDAELEDADSPDNARTKRRLVSRKDMRTASNRKSPSTDSSRAASSPEAVTKATEAEEPKPLKRKAGRPRTMSLSSQVSEAKTKRIKSSAREAIALFDTGATKKRKSDDAKSRPVSGSIAASVTGGKKGEDTDDVDEDTTMTGIEEEQEKKAKAEREEREEAVRKEQEEMMERKRKEAEERALHRKQKLDALPSALHHVLTLDGSDPARLSLNLSRHFLPLQAVSGGALGLEGDDQDSLWMLNYQAAGILGGGAADVLLDLAVDGNKADAPLSDVRSHPALAAHRTSMQVVLGSASFSSDPPDLPSSHADVRAKIVAMKAMRNRINTDSNKFLTMEPLSWISVKGFLSAKADLQENHAAEYPHLEHLPALEVALDACLDDSPFEPIKTESPRLGSMAIPPSPCTPMVVDEELRKSIGHGLKEGDGRCSEGHLAAIRGMTKVEVVID
ncbi:hypothetical protein CAC42_3896 [Sphaceloma murrayae]|uniref:DUF7593 domain-containing protein n=1 Tax=Sphaceloma murrayae TaxID=2082308 RepID=A0A2K1QS78_9PEZI|nr:hypothetical protein CAC42_3896 [Sphaceloma murrayae]